MKKTAIAPANIAFIKYWGKKNEKLKIPENSSISMNLDKCYTVTTVEFDKKYRKDSFGIIGEKVNAKESKRVFSHLNLVRKKAKSSLFAKAISKNSFPKNIGIAASASGFASLTVAALNSLGSILSQKEISIIARQGSGSACRSIPDGFVEWATGESNEESYAYSLHKPSWWDLRDIVVVVTKESKRIGSTEGQRLARKSIFHKPRLFEIPKLLRHIKKALNKKDIKSLGEIIEKDCLYMHSVMMTSSPTIFYWYPKTVEIIKKVYELRGKNILVYFTIDAGPTVHLICEAGVARKVISQIERMKDIENIIVNKPAKGAFLSENHLF